MHILNLATGSDCDCYMLAQQVWAKGYVPGVDITDAQLVVANEQIEWHCEQFGDTKLNVEFKACYIEKPDEQELADDRFGIVISNCGGFADLRLVEDRPLSIENREIEKLTVHLGFFSASCRLWKMDGFELACENHGRAVVNKGIIFAQEGAYLLDKHHPTGAGKMYPVCGDTCRMLKESRLAPYFEFHGNEQTRFGISEGYGSSLLYDDGVSINSEEGDQGCCQ